MVLLVMYCIPYSLQYSTDIQQIKPGSNQADNSTTLED
jgi:hypothetical protein